MSLEEVRAERLRATREYLDLLEETERALTGAPPPVSDVKAEPAVGDVRIVEWPLADALPVLLGYCDEPQTTKQLVALATRLGRKFETDSPVRAVRAALKKAMAANPDVYQLGWAKFYLRSKATRKTKQMEKALAKTNGTGGRSHEEHGRRTSDGIAKRRAQGLDKWGAPKKLTPEKIEEAKQLLRDGITLTEVSRRLGVSHPTLYEAGIRQRALKREGELLRKAELPLGDQPEGDNVVRFSKS